MNDTVIMFPISKEFMLVAEFDGKEGVIEVPTAMIAACNTKILLHADEQVYAPKKAFPYLSPDGQVHYDGSIFEHYKVQTDVTSEIQTVGKRRRP
jgi:hypothetical protein